MTENIFLPPWRAKGPRGKLSQEYGPPSPAAYARQLARYRNWAFQPSKEARKHSELLWHFMATETVVSDREQQCYHLVYEDGHSVRWVARHLNLKRETVKKYLKRLVAKALTAEGGQ